MKSDKDHFVIVHLTCLGLISIRMNLAFKGTCKALVS